MNEPIHVVDGARTPFLKARNRPGPFAASDLAVQAGRELLMRQRFAPTDLDEVILGCASPSPDEVNIGRVVALRMGSRLLPLQPMSNRTLRTGLGQCLRRVEAHPEPPCARKPGA